MQIYIHRRSKVRDCGCGGKTSDSPAEELKALETEMKEMERKFDASEISKEMWQEFRRNYVKERHRLTDLMRQSSSGRLEYQSAGRKRGDARTLDPPQSEAQRRAMYAAAEGRSTLGISKKVGEEFVGKDADIAEQWEAELTNLQQYSVSELERMVAMTKDRRVKNSARGRLADRVWRAARDELIKR